MIVVDASALVDALVDRPADPELLAALADEELHAPSLLDFEVSSALRGHALAGRLTQARLDQAVEDFLSLTIHRYSLTDVLSELLNLRDNFTVHDAAYVVLASALDARLLTADAKLLAAEGLGVDVRLVPAR